MTATRSDPAGIPWYKTLQARMVVIFFLIILMAMLLATNYLSYSLERYSIDEHRAWLGGLAETVAGAASEPLAQRASDPRAAGRLEALHLTLMTHAGQGVELSVVDLNGDVISSSRPELVGTRPSDPEIVQALKEGASPAAVRLDPGTGRRKIFLATPVALEGRVVGAVALVGSLDRIDATLQGMRLILLTTTLVALLIAGLLSFLLARTITVPVHELTARAAELAGGRFDRLIDVHSEDEVGRLAGMFNHLTVRLRDTLDEISAEKRKAEAILSHMTDGVVALDPEARVILINPAAARLLGLEAGQAGRRLLEVAPGLPLAGPLARALGGEEVPADGVPLLFPWGGLTLAAGLTPLRDASGRVAGAVAVFHDVTEREKLEALRREFVANVSHELRTPLTTIKSYIETILDGAVDDPALVERFLRVAAGETDRMARLVNDLLTLSQLDSGRIRLDLRPLDPGDLVRAVGERFSERCHKKGIALEVRTTASLPQIEADRDRLEQVLTNLVSNAVDFTPAGGRFEIGAEAVPGGVVLAVRDTGVGIPPDDLPRIFERFYRVDKARSREYGGTGLGLAIARELVEAHGGRIAIDSTLGEGTTVRVTLPAPAQPAGRGVEEA